MRYDYDLLGNRIHQASMEAGERWTLSDVAGEPIRARDSRGHALRTTYDALRRPVESHVRTGNDAEILVGRTIYGETQPDPEARNLRGKAYQVFDTAGLATSERYDVKGNLLESSRRLAREYRSTLDWSAGPALEEKAFTSSTSFDALNRPIEVRVPDESLIRPGYNEASLLERLDVNLRGSGEATPFVENVDYNTKGQRERIAYGNGVATEYEYDPFTFRLTHLRTARGNAPLQDLTYTYDPVGNIAGIRDEAQADVYFDNQVVSASNEYVYDALYRLIAADGREHRGQISMPQTMWNDDGRTRLDHPQDGQALGQAIGRTNLTAREFGREAREQNNGALHMTPEAFAREFNKWY